MINKVVLSGILNSLMNQEKKRKRKLRVIKILETSRIQNINKVSSASASEGSLVSLDSVNCFYSSLHDAEWAKSLKIGLDEADIICSCFIRT